MPKKNYRDIDREFTEELAEQWQEQGFNFNQTADWINIYSPEDQAWAIRQPYYHAWLRDIIDVDSEYVLNYGDFEDLKQQYEEWKLATLVSLKTPAILPRTFPWKPLIVLAIITVIVFYILPK